MRNVIMGFSCALILRISKKERRNQNTDVVICVDIFLNRICWKRTISWHENIQILFTSLTTDELNTVVVFKKNVFSLKHISKTVERSFKQHKHSKQDMGKLLYRHHSVDYILIV